MNSYIVKSSILHLLLISLLVITHPLQKAELPSFDVRIAGPLEIGSNEPVEKDVKVQRMPLLSIPQAKIKQDSPLRLPDRFYEYNTMDTEKGEDKTDAGEPTRAHGKAEGVEAPSVNKEIGGISEKEKEGFPGRGIGSKFLFDRETIEKFAKRGSPDSKSLTFDAPEFKHRGYMRMLKQRIEAIWVYPSDAIRQGISGDLYIKFSINKDGSLGNIELIRTSGHRSLDEAAIKAIKDAQPFWPLPDDWKGDDLIINGHFIYILGETMVM